MSGLPEVKAMSAGLMKGHGFDYNLSLALGGLDLRLKSNSPVVVRELAVYYHGLAGKAKGRPQVTVHALEAPDWECGLTLTAKERDPGKKKIKEEYADLAGGRLVRKRLTGMVFLFGGETNLAVGPCLANSNQVINFINNRQIQHGLERGALLAHAAGVNLDGKGLALAGQAGMGKSTLALHLMSRGAGFVSNDRLLITRSPERVRMDGLAKLPRINPGTALNNPDLALVMPPADRERFANLPQDELWSLEHKYDADIAACFGPGRINLSSPLNALVILDWSRGGGPAELREVDLAQRRDLLAAFMKEPGLFYLPLNGGRPAGQEEYLAALAGAPCFALSGGIDFARGADALLEKMEQL